VLVLGVFHTSIYPAGLGGGMSAGGSTCAPIDLLIYLVGQYVVCDRPDEEEPMTETTPATPPHPTWNRWLYPTLAVTGIAVGIFVIVAGAYFLFFVHPSSGHSAQQDCCKSMEGDMKKMMDDPKMPMNKPSAPMPSSIPPMSPMPSMPMPPSGTP
jgi:hypothetical protein